ncbi:MAG: hypothetical protein IJ731_08810 [Eubacterium sp.]|nr:hypothetical protein [Eubacterium sp.]
MLKVKSLLKNIICIILSAVLCMSMFSFVGAYAAVADNSSVGYENLNGKNWMSGIADNRYICEINLPGTHDSATAYCKNTTNNYVKFFGIPVFNSGQYAKTQSLTLSAQLNAGVRYLDLRFSAKDGKLLLCHGNNKKALPVNAAVKFLELFNPNLALLDCLGLPLLSLDTEFYAYEDEECTTLLTCERVLSQVKDFLKENPSETVIITAKRENGDSKEYIKLFKEQTEMLKREINPSTQKEYLYTENGNGVYTKMPTLSEARGKIILMSPDYNELGVGDMLNAKNDAGQTEFMGTTFNYENHWSAASDEKLRYISSFVEEFSTEMSKTTEKHSAYANVIKTNANAVPKQSPYEVAEKVNAALYSQNKLENGRYYGWIMGDFMTKEICSTIWQTNFFDYD